MNKLVLFDIDGTLILHTPKFFKGAERFIYGMKAAWGIDVEINLKDRDGWPDWQSAWDIVRQYGVTRAVYEERFPLYILSMTQFLEVKSKLGQLYHKIPGAFECVQLLQEQNRFILGLLTGNVQSIAMWKLTHAGFDPSIFTIGLYGDKAVDRISLAQTVHDETKRVLGYEFRSKDIFVIGDTVYDIRCGKAINAITVAVTTGFHNNRTELIHERPDLLVDSLVNPGVLKLFAA